MRVFLSAFGQPGHAFPMLALGAALVERGHDVSFETWTRWRPHVIAAGMDFVPAPEYPVFPTRERPLQPYQAVARAVVPTRAAIAARAPDVVVHDVLTLAPALAAELQGIPAATLIPHLYPATQPGFPPFGLGARPPRTEAGRALWSAFERPVQVGLRLGRTQLNELRHRVGLPPEDGLYGGLSGRLCIVATFPALEYPRRWPAHVHVVGPLIWEPPAPRAGGPPAAQAGGPPPSSLARPAPPAPLAPPGDAPLVLVAPSTSQDPRQRLLGTALQGLRGLDVRVLGVTNRRALTPPRRTGPHVRLVGWLRYSDVLPQTSLVICHAGHGTLASALVHGVPVLAVPHGGDMGENAARVAWAGVGVRLPWRLLSAATLRPAARRALGDRSAEPGATLAAAGSSTAGSVTPGSSKASPATTRFAERARELAAWAAANDAPTRACELVEALVG